MKRMQCMAIMNAPSIAQFKASTDPRFTNEPTPEDPLPILNTWNTHRNFQKTVPYRKEQAQSGVLYHPGAVCIKVQKDGAESFFNFRIGGIEFVGCFVEPQCRFPVISFFEFPAEEKFYSGPIGIFQALIFNELVDLGDGLLRSVQFQQAFGQTGDKQVDLKTFAEQF